jgi:hypothetical protein
LKFDNCKDVPTINLIGVIFNIYIVKMIAPNKPLQKSNQSISGDKLQ